MPADSLLPLLSGKRIVVCVGAGGVGKTTVAAAIALGFASRGQRVLCITIDPAKRLADSLGLGAMNTEEQLVSPDLFSAAGVTVSGSLTVLMLDTKRTFDDLVARHASSPEARDRIFDNRIYSYVSTSLAGTQSYMAMEKVLLVPQAIKRLLEPEEVAEIVVFLCSDAAKGITGTQVAVDLGWTAQ